MSGMAEMSQHTEAEDADDSSSIAELSAVMPTSTTTTMLGGGKERMDSLRENLSKQKEQLTALRERALRKSEDTGQWPRKFSMNDSMESLNSLGYKRTQFQPHPTTEQHQLLPEQNFSTPIRETAVDSGQPQQLEFSGSEKLQMLNQRTEQNRALLEQRRRDMAKSLQSVKLGLRQGVSGELGSSMNDLRTLTQATTTAAPVARHHSALDLEQTPAASNTSTDEGRLKLLKNKMKLNELKQSRKEQELQLELHDMRQELSRREQLIQQLESTVSQQSEQLEGLRPLAEQLRERNAELEQSGEMLETTRLELHSAREELLEQQATNAASTDAQVNVELAKQLQELENQLQDLRSSRAEGQPKDAAASLVSELEATIATQAEQLAEKTTELNVLNVNLRLLEEKLAQSVKSKPIFLDDSDAGNNDQLQTDLQQLKQKLDECNKSNIKLKLKCKQAEKQLQKMQSTDAQQQLAQLSAENEQLQQRITVLEDEKGQWQLAHVDTEEQPQQKEEEEEAEDLSSQKANQTAVQMETIRLLEEQKVELQQALEALQLGSESARVVSELSELQLEEQLTQRVQQLETEAQEQQQRLQTLQSEKEALDKKLTHYINENMELLDKLEKLSSSSSAESIEIVERPTERHFDERSDDASMSAPPADTAAANAPSFVSELTQTDVPINESIELLQKIELFTNERREVLAKMEQLQAENASLQAQLEELQRDKQQLSEKSNLSQELSSMQRSSEVVAALDGGGAALLDKCERSLSKLGSELEAYRQANDRNAKLNVSKKLAKEAKNVLNQLTELLHKVKEASSAVETVTVVETVVAVTAPNGKALAEYEQLTAQNAELKSALAALQAELNEQRDEEHLKPLAIEQQQQEEQQLELKLQLEQHCKQLEATIAELHASQAEAQQHHQDELQQLRIQLAEQRTSNEEQLHQLASQATELSKLQEQANEYDRTLNDSEMAHEKHMEQQQRQRQELQSRIATLEGQQSILQTLVAEQKQQLIESYSESEHESNLKLLELQQCRQELETSETRNKELRDKLKKYAVNLKKLTGKQSDLEEQLQQERSKVLELEEQLKSVNSMEELQQQLAEKVDEHQKLQEQLQQEVAGHRELQEQLQREVTAREEMHQQLQQEVTANQELQQQLAQQQTKLSAMPKLKDEVQRLQEDLRNTVHANTTLRQELNELELRLDEQQPNMDELRRLLEQKSLKFDKSKEVIKHRNATIQGLQRDLAELRAQLQQQPEELTESELNQLQALRAQNEQLTTEKASFELAIARLETLHEGIQAKLQQDQSYIETLETQNAELLAKIAGLEDQANAVLGRDQLNQEQVQRLEQQLQEQSNQQSAQEQELQVRLQELTEREHAQRKQLQQLSNEADEAREQLATLQAAHDTLLARHKQQTQQIQQAQAEREQLNSNSEQELHELQEQLQHASQELLRQRQVYDAKLAAKATELDELECDLNAHMERATAEQRELTQQLERAQEQVQARGDELQRLNEELSDVERERATLSREATLLRLQHESAEQDVLELQELRMQAMQDKTEMDNLRTQIDSLCANHNHELQALQQQLAELDTLGQNQTDDQVYIETENKRLTEQLNEMQNRLDEQAEQIARQQQQTQPTDDWMYSWTRSNQANQQQNVPLPAPAIFFGGDVAAAPSPFDEIVAPPITMSTQNMAMGSAETTIEDLQRNVSDLEKHAKELETKLLARNQALAEHEERRGHLERLLNEREQELAQLRADAEERERMAAIEKLIQPQQQQQEQQQQLQKQMAPTLDMFFGGETVTDSIELGLPQHEPVVEELIQPKKAYLCQPEQQQEHQQPPPPIDWGVDMDEDPWAAAAAVENISPQVDDIAMAALHSQIEQLEREKSELVTKTAKLMKRLKEYRAKEQQQTRGGGNNNDLDGAIIEELKHQLELHETRQSKTEELLQQHALEKEKLAKRIDVLTAGNERMAELKERQDMDVQMYQARIRELQEKLQQLESWGEEGATANASAAVAPVAVAPTTSPEAVARIENLQAENLDLNSECQELQSQLEQEKQQAQQAQAEAKEMQQELAELRAKQHELQELAELRVKHKELEELAQLNVQQLEQEKLKAKQLEQALEQAQQAQAEVELLQQQLEELQTKQQELQLEPNSTSDESQAMLQEKEAEIVHLKQRIEELMREDQTEKLVLEILTKNQELQMLRMQNKQLQEEQQQHQYQQEQQQQDQERLRASEVTEPNQELQRELEQVHQHYAQLQQEKCEMEEELRVLNNHVLSSLELEDRMKQTVLELDTKNIEIAELRKSLELLQQAQQAQAAAPAPTPPQQQTDLSALNKQWEALVEQKCSEVASIWQAHLAQREAAYEAQINELTAQQEDVAVQVSKPLDDNGNGEMLLKMQKALETQEMEIVTLKEQLAIRSAEYARLASQYDPFRLQNTLGAAAAATGAGAMSTGSGASSEPLPEYVLKADLDYALMMLHQRDMRVEEMIVELVQLLEERDHLQLKLSDTLRQLEAERSRATDEPGVIGHATGSATVTANTTATGSSSSATSGSPSKFIVGSSSDLTASTAASGSDLKQKLAELQTVKHSKDKAIVDEREQRLQQMIQLQRDMAKTSAGATTTTTTTTTIAPDGAAFDPAPASVSFAQQQQLDLDPSQTSLRSPSMVLMDWILGNNNKNEDDAHQSHSQPQSHPQQHPHTHPPSSN